MGANRFSKERRSTTLLQSALKASLDQHGNGYGADEAVPPPSGSIIRIIRNVPRSARFSGRWLFLTATLLLGIMAWGALAAADDAPASADGDEAVCHADSNGCTSADTEQWRRVVHPECGIVMAPSTLGNGTSGWGVFALRDMKQGQPVMSGDIVIQLTDLVPANIDLGMALVLHEYSWSSEETGGYYEGVRTVSVIPGIGMLSNGMAGQKNVLPARPMVDEAGLTRLESAGAGSVTHFHNFTFFVQRPIAAGSEILLDYGANWFQERQHRLHLMEPEAEGFVASRGVDWLRQHGRCLDNLGPAARSVVPDEGRGAVATRNLDAGSIVAPVPVLPLKRDALQIARLLERDAGSTVIKTHQLFLNYCLGHNKSSLLLYPYSPMVNLINHGGGKHANVRLQWSTSKKLLNGAERNDPTWFHQQTVDEVLAGQVLLNRTAFLLELVAVRPIRKGEEVLLDYGRDWVDAWFNHIQHWQPGPEAKSYAPSYVHDDVIKVLRTEKELRYQPYPDNVFTSCYYRYTDNKEESERLQKIGDTVTAFKWQPIRGIFDPPNLRPCSIIQRREDAGGRTTFTVQIRNRYGLAAEQRIPKGTVHIVKHVPRQAIRFSDKIYTTDQHLENAFRHEIGIPDDVFPEKWKDLA